MARDDRRRKTPFILIGLAGAGALWWWLSGSDDRQSQQAKAGSAPYQPPTEDQDQAELERENIPSAIAQWIPLAVTVAQVNQPRKFQMTTADFARLILAHIAVESAGKELALGDQGQAFGLMQINVAYHPEYAVLPESQKFDPLTNVEYGSRLLASLLDSYSDQLGDPMLAIRAGVSAYNAGAGGVNRALRAGRDPASATYLGEYTDKVLDRFYAYGGYQVFV